MKLVSIILLAMVNLKGTRAWKGLRTPKENRDSVSVPTDSVSGSRDSASADPESADPDFAFAFLVSNIREDELWCITATEGVLDFPILGFRLCDFENAEPEQFWSLDAEGRIHSGVDPDKCVIVGRGEELFDGVRLRIADCDEDTELNKFIHNGATDQIRLFGSEDFCVTNQGGNPDPTDPMRVRPCIDRGDHFFTYKLLDESPSYDYVQLVNDDSSPEAGCLVVKDSEAEEGQKLILGSCDQPGQAWRYDDGLFRTKLDDDMCMQAGRGGTPIHGTKLRLYPCDRENDLQQFDYDFVTIELSNTKFCVAFHGLRSQVGRDPIILKSCDVSDGQDNWNEDDAED